jgi:hypothetical protein
MGTTWVEATGITTITERTTGNMAVPSESDFVPPAGVRAAAKRGLRWHDEGLSGDGLVPKTVREARSIADGKKQSVDKLRRMRAWFARHEVDKKSPKWNDPSPGKVAWELWGGDAGRAWANRVMKKVDSREL